MSTFTLTPPLWGILLAAGQGRRFAQQRPGADKLLAQLPDGRAFLASRAAGLSQRCPGTLAVVAPEQKQRQAALKACDSVQILTSSASLAGMGASLAAAACHLLAQPPKPTPYGVLVALADMPWINQDSYQRLGTALRNYPIVAPVHHDQRGHPVGFQWHLLKELSQLEGDQGARKLLQKHGFHAVAVDDAGVCADVDLPAQLAGP